MKKLLLRIYNWGFVSAAVRDMRQEEIRNIEWLTVRNSIKPGNFLDVGCGTGYAMKRAKTESGCSAWGVDPEPGKHGVSGKNEIYLEGMNIAKGVAEQLPFNDKFFDTIYCSHVLEHVADTDISLQEMKRVMKDDGVLIIGMPSATMALINGFSQYLFTTHQRFVNYFFSRWINTGKSGFRAIFLPTSHSHRGKSFLFDMCYYRVKNWKKIVESQFVVMETLTPWVYPYPEYRRIFPPFHSKRISSSVFFVCKKK